MNSVQSFLDEVAEWLKRLARSLQQLFWDTDKLAPFVLRVLIKILIHIFHNIFGI